ncbi:MAG: DNA repair protein RecO [Candidatus Sumerlaeaceae bacterium]|nr:DNA repair protein RecO [Candidatus Sumerlaeaceae bacterium]
MSRQQTRAFVLGLADYRETSKILRLLSEDYGRLSLVARGLTSPKRKTPPPEPFALVQAGFSLREGKDLGTLASLEIERVFSAPHGSVEAYALASYWFDVVGAMAVPGQGGGALFGLTEGFLTNLEAYGVWSVAVWWHFGRLLAVEGLHVRLDRCMRCEAPGAMVTHVAVALGSALCARCVTGAEDALPVQGLSPGGMGGCLTDPRTPPPATLLTVRAAESFAAVFDATVVYHAGIAPRSYAFLCETLFRRAGARHPVPMK